MFQNFAEWPFSDQEAYSLSRPHKHCYYIKTDRISRVWALFASDQPREKYTQKGKNRLVLYYPIQASGEAGIWLGFFLLSQEHGVTIQFSHGWTKNWRRALGPGIPIGLRKQPEEEKEKVSFTKNCGKTYGVSFVCVPHKLLWAGSLAGTGHGYSPHASRGRRKPAGRIWFQILVLRGSSENILFHELGMWPGKIQQYSCYYAVLNQFYHEKANQSASPTGDTSAVRLGDKPKGGFLPNKQFNLAGAWRGDQYQSAGALPQNTFQISNWVYLGIEESPKRATPAIRRQGGLWHGCPRNNFKKT